MIHSNDFVKALRIAVAAYPKAEVRVTSAQIVAKVEAWGFDLEDIKRWDILNQECLFHRAARAIRKGA